MQVGKAAVGCLYLLCLMAGLGCGESSSSSSEDSNIAGYLGDSKRCLASLGAATAQDRSDLAFYAKDSEQGNAVNPASAGNGVVLVNEYRPISTVAPSGAKPAPGYVVWVGHAEGSEPDPISAVEGDANSETFVMFVRQPDRDQLRRAMKCLDSLGVGAPPPAPG